MEKSQSLLSPTSLLVCEENGASLVEEMDEFDVVIQSGDNDDDEYIQILLDREIVNGGLQMQHFLQSCGGDLTKKARLDGIEYILRKRDLLGFSFHTAYLSITYLDRFLSRRSIDVDKSWAIRLLSMACLSLAAKMEECEVPVLSEFCLEDHNFEGRMIQRMELLVLNTLEWKMGSITPFAFTRFLAKKLFEKSPPRNVFEGIAESILAATRDVKIMSHKPSVIAAAATLVVMDQTMTRNALELKISPLASSGSLKIEDVISCYYQVQEMKMEMERLRLNGGNKSPYLSPFQLQRTEVYGSSSVTPASSAKRKRLVFNQSDQFGDDTPNTKQKST